MPDNEAFNSYASQEETTLEVIPSPTITSQSYPSSSSKVSFTSEQCSVFGTPPSQGSSFVTEELDLDAGLPSITVSMLLLISGWNESWMLFTGRLNNIVSKLYILSNFSIFII